MMIDFDKEIDNAMAVVNNLSRDARDAGEKDLMYAANRAWHQLSDARSLIHRDREKRLTSSQRQGEPR